MRRAPRWAAWIVAVVLAMVFADAGRPAAAQQVDYTAAEQMFGEPVTVSVTGKPHRGSEAPANMTIVTAEQIRRTGAISLPDVLQFVAGLDVRRFGQLGAAVAIRGYGTALNPRVLVLLDGRQVYQDDYGFVSWPLIPVTLTEIRQIEIVRGPAAALYGFNAVSGVINIVTFDPLRDAVSGGMIMSGSQSTVYGEAAATVQKADRAGVRVSASGFKADEFAGKEVDATRLPPRSGAVNATGRVRISPGVLWDLSASISSTRSDLYIDYGGYAPAFFRANSVRSRVSADTGAGLLELDAYQNENRTTEITTSGTLSWMQRVSVVRASDVVKLGSDHTVRLAGEWRSNTISSLPTFSGRLGYTIAAASAMWDWQIVPALSLTNAVRVDTLRLSHQGPQLFLPGVGGLYGNRTITEPSFNSGAVLKLSDAETVRLSVARALQLPSLIDFGLAAVTQYGLIIAGNERLRPAAVTNVEIDFDRSLEALASTLRLALFGQRTDTTLGSPFGSGASVLPDGQRLVMARNFGSSREVGGELEVRGEAASWRWSASYALAAIKDDTPDVVLSQAASVSYQRQTPVHAVMLGAGRTWERLEIDAQLRWQSHYQGFRADQLTGLLQPITVRDYVTANVHAGFRLTEGVTLSLTGNQALQQRLMQTAGLRTERRLLAGLRVLF